MPGTEKKKAHDRARMRAKRADEAMRMNAMKELLETLIGEDISSSGKLPLSASMTAGNAIIFLLETARYFENRPTHGEDNAHWSNIYNAENCRKIAALVDRKG